MNSSVKLARYTKTVAFLGFVACISLGVLYYLFSQVNRCDELALTQENIEFRSYQDLNHQLLEQCAEKIHFAWFAMPSRMGIPLQQGQYCAVESAARSNPEKCILFWVNDALHEKTATYLLQNYTNVHVLNLNLNTLFSHTPLFQWYTKNAEKFPRHFIMHIGDGVRLGLLFKFGGIYLDLDMISLNSIKSDCEHNLAYELDGFTINGAYMCFQKSFNLFLLMAMQKFHDTFDQNWTAQGPKLLTELVEIYGRMAANSQRRYQSVRIAPADRFYPIAYQHRAKLFRRAEFGELHGKLAVATTLHMWNYLSSGEIVEQGSIVDFVFKQQCPQTRTH